MGGDSYELDKMSWIIWRWKSRVCGDNYKMEVIS